MKILPSILFSTYLLTSSFAGLSLVLEASSKKSTCPFQSFGYEQLLCPEIFPDIPDEQNTLEGLSRSTGTITVENYKNIICSQQLSNKSGGVFDAASVILRNITDDIKFISNITAQKGGAIYTTGNCSITENSAKQYFISNQSIAPATTSSSTNYGGAICCGGTLELSKNRGAICFAYNTARIRGGAISSDRDFKISGNSAPILLMNNLAFHLVYVSSGNKTTNAQGGAIYCQNCEISDNSAPVCITSNTSPVGGACHATSTVTIKNNSDLIFFANNSGVCDRPLGAISSGGAISATTIKIEDNSGPICFNNNIVDRNGGALWCQTLTIKNNSSVQFINNRSKWGAAFLIKNNGTCDLSADNGDIIFDNNCGITGNNQLYRNTIHCTTGTTLKVGARKNYCVKFYDPIECVYQSPLVSFNGEEYHEGTILLSGVFVPDSFKGEGNFISYIRNPITIKKGVLAIEDRAGLAVYKITQENSTLRLGNGAILRTNIQATANNQNQTTAGSEFAITSLALNLPSLLQKGAQAPKIWIYPTSTTNSGNTTYTEDNNPVVTLSGPLQLFNSDNEDPYDSLDLSSGITRVPFLYLCDNATKKITATNLDIEAINKAKRYGYQGVWSPYWEEYTTTANTTSAETTNTSHRILYADWTPTGYIPNPKYKTPLIANALWGSVYSTLSGMRTLPSPIANPNYFELGGQGLLMTVHQRNRLGICGFHMESAGYAATSSAATETNHKISLAFSQQMLHIKEHATSNKVSSKNYFGGIQLRLPWLEDALVTTGSLAYNYGDHTAKHFYSDNNKDSEGYFYSHTFGASLNCILNLSPINNAFSVSPFIEALAFRATLSSFIEQGDFARKFTVNRPLETITLPIGIVMQWKRDVHLPTIWQVQLAYHPVVYRHYPKVLTTLLASSGTWPSLGTPITRHALAYKIGNETKIFSHLKIFLNYQGEFSSSTFSNYLKAGSALTF
ncbi:MULTISPECIES: polymorphic outer membrane protein middle domain-containing protein [Chlamydia]|uniref:Autotransporter domain-containing protein n=1 Tax=Chlamydia crocodili TaxID=2766982 RepID=A0ABX8CFS2_9CHLA|nr:polymorphic outer membrane protein middle domain-containing protein [Chlamydia crocodili]QVE48821.1 autotransporter domain-containing protein [Chlamydia crocodili]